MLYDNSQLVVYQITLLNAVVVDPLLIHLRLQQTLQETVVKMSGLVAKSFLFEVGDVMMARLQK